MRRIIDLPTASGIELPPGGDMGGATPDQRIVRIWPLVIARATAFVATLKPRQRVYWDAEDVAQALWVALRAKDHKWNPDRGAYTSFAATVIHSELCSMRDQADTVEAPRNVTDRLREYQAAEEQGTLTPRCAATFESIRRVVGEWKPVGDADRMTHERPDDLVEAADLVRCRRDAVADAMRALSPLEARITGLSYGLWGQPVLNATQIADAVGIDVKGVRRARKSAAGKIRERLLESGHPHVASEN